MTTWFCPGCNTNTQFSAGKCRNEGCHRFNVRWDSVVVRGIYMVLCNNQSGSVFVKEFEFFKSQGGLNWEKDPWGKNWKPVVATSVEDARKIGCSMFPEARPYERQAPAEY